MAPLRRTALAFTFAFAAAFASSATYADAISDNVVKIGVLTDMSG